MAEYDNTNRWSLFKNEKRRNDKDSEYNGSAVVTCPHCNQTSEHWLNAWIQTSKKNASKFFSGPIRAKEQRQEGRKQYNSAPLNQQLDDDIPF